MKKKFIFLVVLVLFVCYGLMAGGQGQGAQGAATARPSITVYGPANMEEFPAGQSENNNRLINFIKEKTGMDVNWIIAPSANGREAMNMLLASGSPPDMIFTGDKGAYNDYTNQRLLYPVDDFVAATKNIKTIVPEDTWRAVESGGKHYAIPVPQNQFANIGIIARSDYLEKLGNPSLVTLDDFVNLFQKALDQKIGGNDTIPYTLYGVGPDVFAQAYGLGVTYDDLGKGVLESTWISENARAYLQFMAGLYSRKLIDQEYAVNTAPLVQEKMVNGRALMYTAGWTEMNTLERTIVNNDKAFSVIAPPNGPTGQPTLFNNMGPVRIYFFFPVQAKNTQAAVAFLDRCIEDDIRLTISYGWEGEHWIRRTVDGRELIDQTPEAENLRYRIYYNMWDTEEDFLNRMNLKGFASGYYPMSEYIGKVNLMDYAPPIRELTEFSSTLNDLKNEYFMKIITGAMGINMFDEFVRQWKANGGEQVLAAINTWYATFK